MSYEPLQRLRKWMKMHAIEAFIIPSNDPHFSEYVAPYWACRAWLSGFNGSAGTTVVTLEHAALWTDSRYFLQAENQLNGTGVELQRAGLPETPTQVAWLAEHLAIGNRIGVDGGLFSRETYETLGSELAKHELSLICTADPFAEIWPERPALPAEKATLLEEKYSGEATFHKLERIRSQFEGQTLIVSMLDEIAWALNLRGGDIEYSPLAICHLSIEPTTAKLFIDSTKLTQPPVDCDVLPYGAFEAYLQQQRDVQVVINPQGISQLHYELLEKSGAKIQNSTGPSVISRFKAVKNTTEMAGFRQAMELDGAAMVRFERWLEQEIAEENTLTELSAAQKLRELRERGRTEGYRGESFEAIVGYGQHGAIVHYTATEQSNAAIGRNAFLLVDSGGQYLSGTTDITRTYHFGTPSAAEKTHYTAVLKGMIDLSRARFPVGTRGAQLDILARQHLWQQGLNYGHGTGHGVGHYLCVHEGPQSIRMQENPTTLETGMVQSCEPGLYLAEQYGIRIENLTAVQPADAVGFLAFETLTLCPISTAALDATALEEHHRVWLNEYHAEVYRRLAPNLTSEEAAWLKHKTKPL